MANKLISEHSPYLLQHAQNPVNWYPWGVEALSKAAQENKLIIVSIGYSACHWCHVMEHESFENNSIAEVMNAHFICIKIDREERPDIDQVYMNAVQLMTGSGGWPLNCICLPDQRPIYGGTYFKANDWKNLLLNLVAFWHEKPEQAIQYAGQLTQGIQQSEQIIKSNITPEYTREYLKTIVQPWKQSFDLQEGGYKRAPKFPLPNNWQFLLRYAKFSKDDSIAEMVHLSLQKMAYGGIYDHIGGGFSRYSVDALWHIPHFEKMLYDNAQLVSLYVEAYQHTPTHLYKQVVYQTLEFVQNELTSPEIGFYAALDADSEGEEGKFYTFTQNELYAILGDIAPLFCDYFGITEEGNWAEEHTNVLFRKYNDNALIEKWSLSLEQIEDQIAQARLQVQAYRNKRIRPGLDHKILTAWNGLMLKAYTDAYRVFSEPVFLDRALANAAFILKNLCVEGELLRQHKSPKADNNNNNAIKGFLDDYAFVVDGLISLYEVSFDEHWLLQAQNLADRAIADFYHYDNGLFNYVSKHAEPLIAGKQEIMDNVIPASNSAMAHNLSKLGRFFDRSDYTDIATQQLRNVAPYVARYGSAYSNWASLLLNEVWGVFEIAIIGTDANDKRRELEQYFIPNKILLGGTSGSLPLFHNKTEGTVTRIFVCKDKVCQLPSTDIQSALKQILA